MKTRHHNHIVVLQTIVQAIGKAFHEKTARVTVVNPVSDRKGKHRFQRVINGVYKLIAETGSLRFIPLPRSLDISQRGSEEPGPRH